jgi:hypothetical protein
VFDKHGTLFFLYIDSEKRVGNRERQNPLSSKGFFRFIGMLPIAEETIGDESIKTAQRMDSATEMTAVVYKGVTGAPGLPQ